MRRLALAIFLACVLSGVSRAGEIHPTGAVAPPPPPPATITENVPAIDATASSTVITIILALISIR